MNSRLHLHTTLDGETTVGCDGEPSVVIDGSPDVGSRLLCLAAMGCYANTLLAEAIRSGIWVRSIDVEAELQWVDHSVRAQDLTLSVRVETDADEPTIMDLIERADRASQVANSLRFGVAVRVADAVRTACRLD